MSELFNTQPGDHIAMFEALVKTGLFSFGMNEVGVRSLVDDPPKFTLESSSGSLGGWSARYVLPNGSPVELALIQFKKDERTRGRDDLLWGEWTVHIKGPKRWEGPDDLGREDDGMILVFICTHDYVWMIGQPGPHVPQIVLPPPPTDPVDEWTTPDSHMRHLREISRIEAETGFFVDEGRVNAYLTGRNRDLGEVHDDEVFGRANLNPDPCSGTNRVPLQ